MDTKYNTIYFLLTSLVFRKCFSKFPVKTTYERPLINVSGTFQTLTNIAKLAKSIENYIILCLLNTYNMKIIFHVTADVPRTQPFTTIISNCI